MVLGIIEDELRSLSRFDNPTEYDFYRYNPDAYTIKSEPLSIQNQKKISRYLATLGLG